MFDHSKSFKEPVVDSFMLKMLDPNGSYRLNVGQFRIVMDAGEKQNLIEEWELLERLFAEWRAMGKTCDFEDEAFSQFLQNGHNRK